MRVSCVCVVAQYCLLTVCVCVYICVCVCVSMCGVCLCCVHVQNALMTKIPTHNTAYTYGSLWHFRWFQRFLFLLPDIGACSVTGSGNVAGEQSSTSIYVVLLHNGFSALLENHWIFIRNSRILTLFLNKKKFLMLISAFTSINVS